MNTRQNNILNCIKRHGRSSSQAIADCVSLPAPTVRREIQALRKQGIKVTRSTNGYFVERSF